MPNNIIKPFIICFYKLIPSIGHRHFITTIIACCVYIFFIIGLGHIFLDDTLKHIANIQLIDPAQQAKELINANKLRDAQDLLEFYLRLPFFEENAELTDVLSDIINKRNSIGYRIKETTKGFIYGESNESYGAIASIASDFLVVGDIRDLVKEGHKYINGQEINTVTAALATIGVLITGVEVGGAVFTTASALAAPATGGTSTAATIASGTVTTEAVLIKSAISIIKQAYKVESVSNGMKKYIINLGKSVKVCNSFREALPLFEKIYEIYKEGGTEAAFSALQFADNLHDIESFARASVKLGKKSGIYFKIGGASVADIVNNQKFDRKLLDQSMAFGKNGVDLLRSLSPGKFELILRGYKEYTKGDLISVAAVALSGLPWEILAIIELTLFLSLFKTARSFLRG